MASTYMSSEGLLSLCHSFSYYSNLLSLNIGCIKNINRL